MTNPSAQTMLERNLTSWFNGLDLVSGRRTANLQDLARLMALARAASAPAAVREATIEECAKIVETLNLVAVQTSAFRYKFAQAIRALATPEEASTAAGEAVAWQPLPYLHPADLVKAFNNGSKFVLHYHGKKFDVTHMQAREHVVYVQPPGLPVKVRADGSSAEGTSKGIWLAAAPPAAQTDGVREALEKFTAHYEPWMDRHADDAECTVHSRHTFGDLRRARAAMAHCPQVTEAVRHE